MEISAELVRTLREKTGVGLKIDTLRANVELQNEKQGLIDAQTATRTTAYVLAELLDLPLDQPEQRGAFLRLGRLFRPRRGRRLRLSLARGGGRLGQILGRRRIERHIAGAPERQEHPVELPLTELDAAAVHQLLGHQPPKVAQTEPVKSGSLKNPPSQRITFQQPIRIGSASDNRPLPT